jgi:hypothetical protein
LRALDGDLRLLLATMGPVVAIILVIIVNYQQLIGRFPCGGGASAAAGEAFGQAWSFVPIGALIGDFVLTITISAAAGARTDDHAGAIPADNLDRWAVWLPTFTDELGPDHPATLTARDNLAWSRGEAGDHVRAVAEFEGLLVDRLRVQGPDHPDTRTTRNNIAYRRGEAGEPGRAVAEFEELRVDRLRVLGPDHLDTLLSRENLAWSRGEAGDHVAAVAEIRGVAG